MVDSDRVAFGEIMAAFCTTFDKPLSDPLLDIYFGALEALTFSELKDAANKLLVTARFFPKPVDFIEAVRGSADDQALKGWLLICEALDRVGWNRSVFIEDRTIAYALEQTFGGWIQCGEQLGPLCPSDPMFASLRKTFLQNYGLARFESRLLAKQDRYFPSLLEAQNRDNIAQWRDRKWPQLEDGTPYFGQKIGIIRDGSVIEFEATYSATTARLTDGCRRLLLGEPEPQRQLVAAD